MALGEYIKETRGELKHVSWPTRKQAVNYTLLVVGVSLIVAGYLGLLDFIFRKALEILLAV